MGSSQLGHSFPAKACYGMGLRDPYHSNMVMGAHIWWKWFSMPSTPWASLWTAKYANNRTIEELIQISEVNPGFLIWNTTKQHKFLIQ